METKCERQFTQTRCASPYLLAPMVASGPQILAGICILKVALLRDMTPQKQYASHDLALSSKSWSALTVDS